ncbi:MAG TPA: hypothetical protein VNH40_11940 [Gaiellaceae bacterium]|nr:hypothetical protein [Gaiellaceae bacterium]
MTTTTALILNLLLMAGVVGALASVVRLGLRLPAGERSETLHPSQPLPATLFAERRENPDLSLAA